GARIEHEEGAVDVVPRLSRIDAKERLVGRQSAELEPLELALEGPQDEHVDVPVDLLGGTALLRDVDGEPRPVRDRRCDERRADGQPARPPVRHAGEEGLRLPALERRGHPPARLVARLVPEPQNALPAMVDGGDRDADGLVGHPAPDSRRPVPGHGLVRSRLVRHRDQPLRRAGRPVREVDRRREEPPLPNRTVGAHRVRAYQGRSPSLSPERAGAKRAGGRRWRDGGLTTRFPAAITRVHATRRRPVGGDRKTIVFFPEGAFGPTNNCVGIGNVLRERGHRVVFVVEESFAGTLEARGFEEARMRLTPPPEVEEEPGQFWKDFIRDTAPEFRKPTIEQLETFLKPTWQALIDGSIYAH